MPSSSRTESSSKYTSIIITDPSTKKKAALSKVWSSLKPKRLEFEIKMGQITNPQIQPLLSLKVELPEKMTLDRMKYEFSKPFCPPSKTDFGSDEK